MPRRIAIIQGHPDTAGHHLLHAMADAYADAAVAAGHEVRRIDVAKLDFPLLRTQEDFAHPCPVCLKSRYVLSLLIQPTTSKAAFWRAECSGLPECQPELSPPVYRPPG